MITINELKWKVWDLNIQSDEISDREFLARTQKIGELAVALKLALKQTRSGKVEKTGETRKEKIGKIRVQAGKSRNSSLLTK